jgi:hypothetical protein
MKRVLQSEKFQLTSLFLVLFLVLYYPLSINLQNGISVQGDANFVAWVIDSGLNKIAGIFNGFDWNASMGYPYSSSLLFSDHSLGLVIQSLPLIFFERSVQLIVNYNVMVSLFLGYLGMYYLGRQYKYSKIVSLISSVAFTFCVYRLGLIGHLQIFSFHYIVLFILFSKMYLDSKKNRYALLSSIFFLLNSLISIYLLAFGLILLVTWKLIHLKELRKIFINSKPADRFIQAAINFLPFVFIALAYIPYIQISKDHNVTRSLYEAVVDQTNWRDAISAPEGHLFLQQQEYNESMSPTEHQLYFGVTVMLIIAAGLYIIIRKKEILNGQQRKLTVFGIISMFIGLILGLGPYWEFNGNRFYLPYNFLFENVFFFRSLRATSRFNIITFIGLSILFLVALSILWNKFKLDKRLGLLAIGLIIVFIDVSPLKPISYTDIDNSFINSSDYAWMVRNISEESVVAYVPVNNLRGLIELQFKLDYKNINLYSGVFPQGNEEFDEYAKTEELIIDTESSDQFLSLLSNLGVDYLVYLKKWETPDWELDSSEQIERNLTLHHQVEYNSENIIVINLSGLSNEDFKIETFEFTIDQREEEYLITFRNEEIYPINMDSLKRARVEITFIDGSKTSKKFIAPLFLKPKSEYSYNLGVSSDKEVENVRIEYLPL